MRVLICGGRDFDQQDRAWAYLDARHARTPFTLVVTGLDPSNRRGADDIADRWAQAAGVDRVCVPPNWVGRGKPGGPFRNGLMLRLVRPELVLAFEGDRGTRDMMAQARADGVHVVPVGWRG